MSKTFRKDLTGQRFGRLTVIEFVPTEDKYSYWKCKCDCGNEKIVAKMSLTSNLTISCGCYLKNKKTTHGKFGTRIYTIWTNMKVRCSKPDNKGFKYYGARGIKICDEWENNFKAFYDWSMENGYDDTLTIDRIDVNGNYEPNNCRWTTMKEQERNKRNNVIVEYQGQKMSLAEASELSGIKDYVLRYRYKKGDRGEQLFRPVLKK